MSFSEKYFFNNIKATSNINLENSNIKFARICNISLESLCMLHSILPHVLFKIFRAFIGVGLITGLFLCGCSSYFSEIKHIKISPQTLTQSSRIGLFTSDDNELKIATRLTYLNDLDNLIYSGREYFFLEIFNDSEDVVLPDSLQISMFNKKPVWIRQVQTEELDDILVLENQYAIGYLIAFQKPPIFLQKHIVVDLTIANFGKVSYNFSYAVISSTL